MNQGLHRIVFNHRRGQMMAVAECASRTAGASGRGTAGGAGSRPGSAAAPAALAVAAAVAAALAAWSPGEAAAQAAPAARAPVVFASQAGAPRQNLPQPYGTQRQADGRFVNDPTRRSFVDNPSLQDRVSWTVNGTSAVLDQGNVDRLVLNWDSFDIGAGFSVRFKQNPDPTRQVSALNRIWSADPSLILGTLKADREVILLNANGVYFGRGAVVDTGRFVATTLGLADGVFEKGLRNITNGSPAFTANAAGEPATRLDSAVTVEDGALIRTAAGGDVLLVAPRVSNRGRVETPGGQTVLAAGERVYLMSSSDPAQRGLIVAVDPVRDGGVPDPTLGIVDNGAQGRTAVDDGTGRLVERINEIRAEAGTINLVGLTVRQAGQLNATTAVKGANGIILLQAMSGTTALAGGPDPATPASLRGLKVETGSTVRVAAGGGTVQLDSGSLTAVRPDTSGQTQIDAEVFNPSRVRIEGADIRVGAGARIEAPGGKVDIVAAQNRAASPLFNQALTSTAASGDGSRIVIEPQAQISVAGLQGVTVDGARNQGQQRLFRIELADAPVQRSGPLYRSEVFFDLRDGSRIGAANVSGAASAVRRSAEELSTRGGQLQVAAEGTVVVGQDAGLDVSGGSVRYTPATLRNTVVLRDGRPVQFNRLAGGTRVDALAPATADTAVPGYVEGQAGGRLLLDARALALAGDLQGRITSGERQLAGLAAPAAPATLQVGQSLGGGYTLSALSLDAAPAAPLAPAWLAGTATPAATTVLSLAGVQAGGFGSLVLQAAHITQPQAASLVLGSGGQLSLRAERIALDGRFSAPGGSIELVTTRAEPDSARSGLGDITLGDDTRLDTAGRWVNQQAEQAPASASASTTAVPVNGGSVRVSAAHALLAQPGAAIDVSGGARLSASGALTRGSAGAIGLSVGRSELLQPVLQLSALSLSGFDFAAGGRLTLGLPATRIGSGATATLHPGFFSDGGFGSFTLTSYGDTTLMAGTQLAPVLDNWVLRPDYRTVPSGVMAQVAAPAELDTAVADRRAVNLSLAATRPLNPAQGQPGSQLVVERGAGITLEPGATLALSATRDIWVGASGGLAGEAAALSVPGGTLQLTLLGSRGASTASAAADDPVGFLGDQAIWLGADARLSVAGTARLRDAARLPLGSSGDSAGSSGTVWAGGTIALDAQRGYVVAQAGSQLALDGAAAVVDLPAAGGATRVARPAGTLRVSSPEGFALEGNLSAQPPRDAAGQALADGGRVELTVGLGGVNAFTSGAPYPDARFDLSGRPLPNPVAAPREVVVSAAADAQRLAGARPGADLQPLLGNGLGRVGAAQLIAAGFDALRLGAGDAVRLAERWDAYFPRGVVLDAPAVVGEPGAQVALGGAYASLGDRALTRQGEAPDRRAAADRSPAGDTTLRIAAPTIELVGTSALRGFSQVALDAGGLPGGEVRFSAVAPALTGIAGTGEGRLAFAGTLTLTAAQQYATTGSRFTVAGVAASGDADPGSRLVLATGSGGAAATAPLSVFGSLTLAATDIVHGGTIRQPFGQVALLAERTLDVGAGSLTSVSGDGLTALYGATDNLSQWLQPSGVYAEQLPLDKGVTLRAAQVRTAPGSRVDASGGGQVLAWEFFAGVGGSRDVFAADNVFAVLPDHAAAPATPLNGGVLGLAQPGQQWVLTMPVGGLAPGAYSVMPARYALLAGALPQGAFLVRRASEPGRAPLQEPQRQDDGSLIVTGYLRDIGSVHTGTPGERWVVESPEVFRARSEVRLSSVDTLLQQRAQTLGQPQPLLPSDAGRIEVRGSGNVASPLQGTLDLGAAAGGRAGLLDLAGEHVAVVDDPARAPAGSLWLGSQALSDSGAGSVLLGGVRSEARQTDGSTRVQVVATGTRQVTLDSPTRPLQAEELLVAASDRVSVAAGTALVATGRATLGPRTLVSQGDGALLAVGANPVILQRSGSSGQSGQVAIGADARLAAPHVALDATRSLVLDPSVQLQADALTVAGRRIAVGGEAPATADTTALGGTLLQTVQQVDALTLIGYESIDFIGLQDWAQRGSDGLPTRVLDRLVLDTPLLRGLADAQGRAAQVDMAARAVSLSGGTAAPAGAPAAAADSRLQLQALPAVQAGTTGGLTLGPGAMALSFADTQLRSTGDIVVQGAGHLAAAGDLTLASARLTATTGAQQSLRAEGGTLRVQAEPGARSQGERVGQGARLELQARTLVQAGWLDLPGGSLGLVATGLPGSGAALTLSAGSLTSVAGFALPSSGSVTSYGHAGRLLLQADLGRIALDGTLDVSAAAAGDAGQLTLSAAGNAGGLDLAPAAALLGRAGTAAGDRGGHLRADLRTLASVDPLALAAATGGFGGGFALRVRSGDVSLTRDLQAQRVSLAADAGALSIDRATLDARSPEGGVVQLAAGTDLRLGAAARIDARSSAAGSGGGDVLLAAASGRITLAPGAAVDARGDDAADGRIVLRAARGADNASVQVDALDTPRLQAGEVVIEAVRTWTEVTVGSERRDIGAIGAGNSSIGGSGAARVGILGQAAVRADNNAFMAAAPGVLAQLGVDPAEAGRVRVAAGVEVRANGNLSLAADWALDANADRPGGEPGLLTLRAAGNLVFNGSLSDGFAGAAPTAALGTAARSWSYRLVGGADLTAADPLATLAPAALAATDAGDVLVSAGRLVRTGAGSIEVAAGRDIRFGAASGPAAAGMLYAAGRRTAELAAIQGTLFAGQASRPLFTEGGGRVDLRAGRDVVAPEATQLVNNWLWRSGLLSTRVGEEGLYDRTSQLAWWAEFSRLRQTVGVFGGGSLRVQAGRDVVNLQAFVTTSGWADSRSAATAALQLRGGGDLEVQAGRDVLGGQFVLGRGSGRIDAGGSIGLASGNAGPSQLLLGALSGTGWRLSARDGLAMGTLFNPTAAPVSTADSRGPVSGFFYTWDGSTGLSLSANAGAVQLIGAPSTAQLGRLGLFNGAETTNYFRVLPAQLSATAAGGDLRLLEEDALGALLFPSATGSLALWAGRDLLLGTENSTPNFAQADSALSAWPGWRNPVSRTATQLAGAGGLVSATLADQAGRTALRSDSGSAASLLAQGSIVSWGDATWLLAQAAELQAGQDVLGLRLVGQNQREGDTTRVTAGRNLLAGAQGLIEIGGPGWLEVSAGRGVDLGASDGIVSSGNLRNANLPPQGASVRVRAAAAGTLDLAVLRTQYLQPPSAATGAGPRARSYRADLVDFVRQATGAPVADFDAAWALFQGFPPAEQARFGRQVLAAEFRAVYLDGATPTADSVRAELRGAFERQKAQLLQAGQDALARGVALELPGREKLEGDALRRYLSEVQALGFEQLDLASTVQARLSSLQRVASGWREHVAAALGRPAAELDALTAAHPTDPLAQRWQASLAASDGALFDRYRAQVLAQETSSAAAAASQFGRRSLPMRLALFEQGFRAAELAGAGSFVAQPVWPGSAPLLAYGGAFELTQSGIVTQRGGAIELVNPGGAINVGLKDGGASRAPKGVVALGGGNVFGYARDDFQVNTQRVFIVGQGDMAVWSSRGDIDSGRGANTAVAAPPLAARRSVDGVVFEVPATTTGSGLGILEDARGRRSGSIGLYPAFGEIVALDAFIRAPQVVLGATVKGADNLQAGSVRGAAGPVAAPNLTVAAPASSTPAADTRATEGPSGGGAEPRQRSGLLTVELLGMGADPACSEEDERRKLCTRPPRCSEAQQAAGQCP